MSRGGDVPRGACCSGRSQVSDARGRHPPEAAPPAEAGKRTSREPSRQEPREHGSFQRNSGTGTGPACTADARGFHVPSCIYCLPATSDCSDAVPPTRRVPAQHPTRKQTPDPKYPSKRASRTNRHPPCERTCGRTSWSRFLARRLPGCDDSWRNQGFPGGPRSGAAPEGQPDRCSREGRTPPVGSDFRHLRAARDAVLARCSAGPERQRGQRASAESRRRSSEEVRACGSFSGAPATPPKGLRPDPRLRVGIQAPSASTRPEGLHPPGQRWPAPFSLLRAVRGPRIRDSVLRFLAQGRPKSVP